MTSSELEKEIRVLSWVSESGYDDLDLESTLRVVRKHQAKLAQSLRTIHMSLKDRNSPYYDADIKILDRIIGELEGKRDA